MIRRSVLAALALSAFLAALPGDAAAVEACSQTPKVRCFGLETASASLSSAQAGDHPDLTIAFGVLQDPESAPNVFGLHDAYAATRNVRIDLPPGLIGDPNVLGVPQQCTVSELLTFTDPEGGCPNGSQVGLVTVLAYGLKSKITEPLYMMAPPGGEVVARLGFIAGIFPTFLDAKVRSEGDYGISLEVANASAEERLVSVKSTTWGVPADPVHDTERCLLNAALFEGCVTSPPRPPGSRPLPFLTNPTRCGAPLQVSISASSWAEADRYDTKLAPLPTITGCNRLPFGPDLTVEPTSHRAGAPTGADVTIRLPASDGVDVLEPSQIKDVRVTLPEGMAFNPGAADGLATCSAQQVHFGERVAAECPDAAKVAGTEFDVAALPRRMKGAVYLREPEPGNLFRLWIVADDLGAHVKLPGQLEVDKRTGQITEVTLGVPQVPTREVKLLFKSGLRAPLINPPRCGEYRTRYEYVPWSGAPPLKASTPMQIDDGCEAGAFAPRLQAGATDLAAGQHSRFLLTLTREDGEENPRTLDVELPPGLAASFRGIPRCAGPDAISGSCPAASRIGKVLVSVGAGPFPLWAPQPGKTPTAVYLAGPYKDAPLSVVAVVPAQAGPFDLGNQVVRSALYVDPRSAQGSVKSDPIPQIIEGIPLSYRTIQVDLDRPGFTLNPTGCREKETTATVSSAGGAVAHPSSRFQATDCAKLDFKPRLGLRLEGAGKRGGHPSLQATLRPRNGDANASSVVVRLPRSAFLDQAHIRTICTRVQYAAGAGHGTGCPAGSIYGHVAAYTPLLDEPLEGPVFLRSSSHNLPDLVMSLHGLVDIEAVGRIDSVRGGIRSSFEAIPDAPLSKVVLEMQGGAKGLIVNSTNLCAGTHRAEVKTSAHNGKASTTHPAVEARCGKARRGRHRR